MNTFIYRDSRIERVAEAISALADDQDALRDILEAEQAALEKDDWKITDTTYKAVATDWIWNNVAGIKALVDQDPVFVTLNTASLLTVEQEAAINTVSQPHPIIPPSDYLDRILTAVDNNDNVFTQLLHAAHQAWLMDDIDNTKYPFDDVGVLLPLRLETLFDAPASKHNEDVNRWKISVRVIPDEASICRDNAFISKDEEKALIAFWQAIKQDGNINENWLDTESSKVAWQQLTYRVKPERAAWLVSHIQININGAAVKLIIPADMPAELESNRVGGIPPELKVFAKTTTVINGEDHFFIGRLPMDKDVIIDTTQLTLPLPSDFTQKDSWLISWEKAKAVGLGGEFSLPEEVTPQNIGALYVVGIGDESPKAHFTSQVNSGELSIPRLGQATNTVHGQTSIEEIDWLKVARARLSEQLNPLPKPLTTGGRIQMHLTGQADGLPFFPGSDAPDETLKSQALVKALWPALWGNWQHDIWDLGDASYRRALWAFENFCPEGPLMPLRIRDQPYGLLPVTSLELWSTPPAEDPESAAQFQEELKMAKMINQLRAPWANSAREKRSIVGKTSSEFMELLAQDAISQRYVERKFFPISFPMALYGLDNAQRQEYRDITLDTYKTALAVMEREPKDLFVAVGHVESVHLPLVQSTRSLFRHQNGENRKPFALIDLLMILIRFFEREAVQNYDLELVFKKFHILEGQSEFQLAAFPDSLLIRLLVHAVQTSTLSRQEEPGNQLLQQVVDRHQKYALKLANEIDREAWQKKETDLTNSQPVFKSIIPDDIRQQWERSFCATLDSAAHRIDPWLTGFAWQRLKAHSASSRHNHRLGAYGWLDGPFNGQPGPTESGLLHTPSHNQTMAALIMRDKYLSSSRTAVINQHGQSLWEMNMTSEKIRVAEEIADEVRMGFHIYEVVGRHVENIVGHPMKVRALRSNPKYSMRSERNDPNEVCDGSKALLGLLNGDAEFVMNDDQQKALQLLHDSLDTYSDLLTSDGIIQAINRRTDRAAEVTDAMAGFSQPPSFEFIRTPPSGYQLETIVLSALPFVSLESVGEDIHPIRLADPSVAAFLENKLGNDWTWTAINDDNNAVLGSVKLQTLKLSCLDTLALSDDMLRELVRHELGLPLVYISNANNRQWDAFDAAENFIGRCAMTELNLDPSNLPEQSLLNKTICITLGIPDNSTIKETEPDDLQLWVVKNEKGIVLGCADKKRLGVVPKSEVELPKKIRQVLNIAKVRIDAPREHQLAQELLSSLGNRPASGRDLTRSKTEPASHDTRIYGELVKRYAAVFKAGKELVTKLKDATNDADRTSALREALPWGIVPAAEPADREALMSALVGLEVPEKATPLKTLTKTVADALNKRLKDAIQPKDLISPKVIEAPLENHKEIKQANKPDGVSSLSTAIATLASPNAKIVILACWDKTDIIKHTGVVTNQPENIDVEWLTVVASVRANLARLEALQLEIEEPFVSWTSSPTDPWRAGDDNIVKENLKIRENDSVVKMKMDRFVAAYGTTKTWSGDKVAVGLIDSFNEAVPMPQRKTVSAFGFNAPSARAQQAILLAVPPKPRQRLNEDLLLKILEETRTLAHARTARMEDLGSLGNLSPTMWLQNEGVGRVRLEPWPLFVV
jgi:hypothetical protein